MYQMTIEKLQSILTKKGYKWESNLNIIGVRNKTVGDKITNKFDDTMYVAYKEAGAWNACLYFHVCTGVVSVYRCGLWSAAIRYYYCVALYAFLQWNKR